jgi:hypothetical protein
VRGMSAEGLRCLLSKAGVEEAVAQRVMSTVDNYLAQPDTPPLAVCLTKSLTWTEDAGTLQVSVFELPLF